MNPFVGRRTELAYLRARMAEARRGRPRIVQVQDLRVSARARCSTGFSPRRVRNPRPGPPSQAETLVAYGVLDQEAHSAGPTGKALLGTTDSPRRPTRCS